MNVPADMPDADHLEAALLAAAEDARRERNRNLADCLCEFTSGELVAELQRRGVVEVADA